ncbi:acylneuraminate cytidylyltransferase family protein [Sporosarcina sp. FSL W7-1283]|uniref:acylneuraminate cytidylyltransferase family protein n=1 Tax=Sporosarcina sp. FSL W7-1283 TaxID=2921560 RepID=UPI0030F9B6F9
MYKDKTFLAVIPARGGSKGIPRKNLYEIQGKPLIAYAIEAAKESSYIDRIIVSTDDNEIAQVSIKYGAEIPFMRPSELATDEAKTLDSLLCVLDNLEEHYDYIITLQPTQPLRTAEHIDQSIERLFENSYSDLVSLSPVNEHPLLIRSIDENGKLLSLLNVKSTVRRQDFNPYYYVNGAIYINDISLLNQYTSLNDNQGYYIIDEPLVDIDNIEDVNLVESYLDNENCFKD